MTPESLNSCYVRESGFASALHFNSWEKIEWWHNFIKAGFTEKDLETVVQRLKREIKAKRRNLGCLRLSNLISNLGMWEEELELAKNERLLHRAPETPKQSIMRQTGRGSVETVKQVVTPADVLAKLKLDLRNSVN